MFILGNLRFKQYYEINEDNELFLQKLLHAEKERLGNADPLAWMDDSEKLAFWRRWIFLWQAEENYQENKTSSTYASRHGFSTMYMTIQPVGKIPFLFQFTEHSIFRVAVIDADGKNYSWLSNWNKTFTKYFRK